MRKLLALTLILTSCSIGHAQTNSNPRKPMLGAQIWIEPGQTPEQVDGWFKTLADSGMPVARLFLMWPYLEPSPGTWNFSLYDAAFRSAEKYHIRIVATLTPSGPPPFLGGDGSQGGGVLPDERSRERAARYIDQVVQRYRNSPALDTWLLVNEPGQPPQSNEASVAAFRLWLRSHYEAIATLDHAWGTSYTTFSDVTPPQGKVGWNRNAELDWRTFWETYQTSQLRWLADQVRAVDPSHPLHLNPAGILDNPAFLSDDLPSWRPFLDTLGCSIHPAWHFGLLDRDQYALGVSYLNELVRGSIEPKPYWVTELQGGNNIYSGLKPMEPSKEDIAQWVWTSIGAGADRVIFWLLNARREGVEAGEWSLLNFQGGSTARLSTAASIAHAIGANESFFSDAKPYASPTTIILSMDTLTFEEVFHDNEDPARDQNAHILSALGFYQAFSELGVPPRVKFFDDYDWEMTTPQPRTAVLPDARMLTEEQIARLKIFVAHGNTLLITGLSGFYGPHAKTWPLEGFPLAEVTGGEMKEVHLRAVTPSITVDLPGGANLPSRLWVSTIAPYSAKPIGQHDGEVIATLRNVDGGGRVFWIPSPIGLGAWLTDQKPLANFLRANFANMYHSAPFVFSAPEAGCLLRVLESGDKYLTVVTNGTNTELQCDITPPVNLHSLKVWGTEPKREGTVAQFRLSPRGTSVSLWR